MQAQAEYIPGEDRISRCFFGIEGVRLDPESEFVFSVWKENNERCESIYWRRYAPDPEDIHARGRRIVTLRNKRRVERAQPLLNYMGAMTGLVACVRAIQTERGFLLDVSQCVEDGDVAHAHLTVRHAPGVAAKARPNDIRELVNLLMRCLDTQESVSA